MPEATDIELELAAIFPEQAVACFSRERPATPELLGAELEQSQRMVEARRLEFAHGRLCARAVLAKLGEPPRPIPTGSNREPIWPAGIVGSISHTQAAAAAVAARHSELGGLGLDMETSEPLSADLIPIICRPDEAVGNDGQRAKLLFSIKEAIYKCIYPTIGRFVDFQEMQVEIDFEAERFAAHAHTPACDSLLMGRLDGAFRITDNLIISGAWLRN